MRLTSHATRAEAVRMLERVLASGITHFDVARAYGFGRAEGILGEFLRGNRSRVTVATKFGLAPPGGLGGNRWVIDTAKKILGPFPGLLRRAKKHGSTAGSRDYGAAAAVDSLHTSLRELGTDYVDALLLHEASLAEAGNDDLLGALERLVEEGKVRTLGLASDSGTLGTDAARVPGLLRIIQVNDNAVDRSLEKLANIGDRRTVTHSVFTPAARILEAAKKYPETEKRFSSRIGADLSDPATVGSLLLSYALHSNRDGVVLFSSTNPQRVNANVVAAQSSPFGPTQLELFRGFLDEALQIPGSHSVAAVEGRA